MTAGANEELIELVAAFDELGAVLEMSPAGAYDALVKVTVDRLPGAESASVTLLRDSTFRTAASSDSVAEQGDALQYRLGSGPCVDAVVEGSVFHTNDLQADERWPEFGLRAASVLGVHSMLAYRLLIDDDHVVAGLNVYSTEFDAFDEQAVTVGFLLATHGALAVNAAMRQERVANLGRALETNRRIATAVGILMAQHDLTSDQAFNVLSVASQRSNRKVQVVAEELIEHGTLDLSRSRRRAAP